MATKDSSDAAPARAAAGHGVGKYLPIVRWLPAYKSAWLTGDVVAGFTIWGLLVPEGIAYASLAGLPPQAGLYTLLASLGLYAVFGSSRQLVVAGTSASAVLTYSAVTALHPANPGQYASLAAVFIIVTGVAFLLFGLFKLGFITQFLSRPVMTGFVFGLAIFVAISQLPKLFGLTKGSGDSVSQLIHVLVNLGSASWTTFAVGAVALALLFLAERFPRVPGGLVVTIAAIIVSALLNLGAHGVDTVGKIPSGLPSIASLDVSLSDLWILLPSAVGMMLVIFSEALGAAQTFADKHGYKLDFNQDMIGMGVANLGSGLIGGLACGGSLSETSVNDEGGARTQLSTIVAALLGLLTVLALTGIFTDLPLAVLGALIIHAVSHLMRVGEMRRFYALVPREFWLGVITLLGVILIDVLPGLIIGVTLSILVMVYRASRPYFSVMGRERSAPGVYEDVHRHTQAESIGGVLIVRPDAPLFYANAQPLRDQVEALVESAKEPVHTLILDIDGSDDMDITSSEALEKLLGNLEQHNVRLLLAHVHDPVIQMMRRVGTLDKVGQDHVFPTLRAAVTEASGNGHGS